jgi:hypothetical protein
VLWKKLSSACDVVKFSPANAPHPPSTKKLKKDKKNYLVCDLRQKSVLTLLVSRHLILFDRQVSFFFSFNFSSILKIFSPFFSFNFHVFDNNYDVVFSPPPSIFRTPRRLVLRAILKRSERRRIFKKCDSIRVIFAKKQNKKDGNFSNFFSFEIVDTRKFSRTLFFNYYIWQRNPPPPISLYFLQVFFFFFSIKKLNVHVNYLETKKKKKMMTKWEYKKGLPKNILPARR